MRHLDTWLVESGPWQLAHGRMFYRSYKYLSENHTFVLDMVVKTKICCKNTTVSTIDTLAIEC